MSEIPENLKYTKDHEWIRKESDDVAIIGITDYAQSSLGDVTFVELPAVGDALSEGETFGVVESVKAASDLFMPVGGEILETNEDLADAPEAVNASPYADAWMIKIKMSDPSQWDSLMDPSAYAEICD